MIPLDPLGEDDKVGGSDETGQLWIGRDMQIGLEGHMLLILSASRTSRMHYRDLTCQQHSRGDLYLALGTKNCDKVAGRFLVRKADRRAGLLLDVS